jgi:hypothetical protein
MVLQILIRIPSDMSRLRYCNSNFPLVDNMPNTLFLAQMMESIALLLVFSTIEKKRRVREVAKEDQGGKLVH